MTTLLAATPLVACKSDNGAPLPVVDRVEIDEDTEIEIDVLANDRDPDGDELRLYRVSELDDGQGSAAIRDNRLHFTPARDVNGEIAFRYWIGDGEHEVSGEIVVDVQPVNDAPTALDIDATAGRNGSSGIELRGRDVEGDALTYEITTGPAHGVLSGEGALRTYEPSRDYVGIDTFQYRVSDGQAASELATVTVDVLAGAAPVGVAGTATTEEDVAVDVTLAASDDDGDALTFEILTPPAHGALAGTPPDLVYTPDLDFNGTDSFTFVARDEVLVSAPTTFTIDVAPINDAPSALPQDVAASEDAATPIELLGADVDGDALTFTIIAEPAAGALSGAAPALTYTPTADYHGADSFTFTVSDGTVTSAPATVALMVEAVNDAPAVVDQSLTVDEDGALDVVLAASDVDGDALQLIVATPQHGTVEGTAPDLVYRPAPDFHGADSFQFTASDGQLETIGVVVIDVAAVNDPPLAQGLALMTDEDQPVGFDLVASDVDGDALSVEVAVSPALGQLTGDGTSWMYTPAPDQSGIDVVTFTISDGTAQTQASVTIDVRPVSDPPRAVRDIVRGEISELITVAALENDSDPDGDGLSLVAVSGATSGTAELVGDHIVYTPAPGFAGTEHLVYTIADPQGLQASGIVHLGVGEFPADVPAEAVTDPTGATSASGLSGDGRVLVFGAARALLPGDSNDDTDVYVYDRLHDQLALISAGPDGTAVGGEMPSISWDGRYLAFQSRSQALLPAPGPVLSHVFVHDRELGTTRLISVASDGTPGNGDSYRAQVSGDGRHVAFISKSYNLADDYNGAPDVFVHDLETGSTARVSLRHDGLELDEGVAIDGPAIDHDGSSVAFVSAASGVVDDGGTEPGVFVRDRTAGTTRRASVSSLGVPADDASSRPRLSSDGRFVAFLSRATNLLPHPDGSRQDAFLHDLQTGNTWRVNEKDGYSPSLHTYEVDISGNGRYVVFRTGKDAWVHDRFTGATEQLQSGDGTPLDGTTLAPAMSPDGRYVLVATTASNIAGPPGGDLRIAVVPNPL